MFENNPPKKYEVTDCRSLNNIIGCRMYPCCYRDFHYSQCIHTIEHYSARILIACPQVCPNLIQLFADCFAMSWHTVSGLSKQPNNIMA